MPTSAYRLTVTGDSAAVAAASAWVRSLGNRLQLPSGDIYRLDLCVSELVTNIADYGYTNGGDRKIELRAEPTAAGNGIRVEVEDNGRAFDPLAVVAPAAVDDVGEARIGGLGIHLVRSFADECRYDRRDGHNVFSLVVNRAAADTATAVERSTERRTASADAAFPLVRGDGRQIERDQRRGQDRRRLVAAASCAIFRNVPYKLLEEILATCPVRAFPDGTVLMRPGDSNHHVAVVLRGRLRIHLGSEDGSDYTEITAGECAGEMSVIDGEPASAYVVADSNCRLMLISRSMFLARLLPIPEVARNIVAVLSQRMRRSNDRTIEQMKSALELDALQRDLGTARDVQASMVPERMTLAPARRELQCEGFMRAARQVGGDFYDAFYLEPNRLALVIGDVCGKGMPAALFMARAMTLLRGEAMHPASYAQRQRTQELVSRTNQQLCRGNGTGYFASVFAAILDVSTGVLTWVNAGHPAPALARGSSAFRYLAEPRNVVLGVNENAAFVVGETALPPGSTLLIYTDGVTEAADGSEMLFGEERLLQLLNGADDRNAPALIETTVAAVDEFSRGRAQSDDLTLLALRYLGEF